MIQQSSGSCDRCGSPCPGICCHVRVLLWKVKREMPIEILQHEQRVYYVALFGQRYSFVARSSILAEDLLISMELRASACVRHCWLFLTEKAIPLSEANKTCSTEAEKSPRLRFLKYDKGSGTRNKGWFRETRASKLRSLFPYGRARPSCLAYRRDLLNVMKKIGELTVPMQYTADLLHD